MKRRKKYKRKLLWFAWAPLILIASLLITLVAVYSVCSYSVEYGKDEYAVSQTAYANLATFDVTESYKLLVKDDLVLDLADEFNSYVKIIMGKSLDVIREVDDKPYIALSIDHDLDCDYRYYSDNVNINIVGQSSSCLSSGAYAFLEEFGGIRCYTDSLIVTTRESIFFPQKEGGYSQSYNYYFEMSMTDSVSSLRNQYALFRGLNMHVASKAKYISSFCHTFANVFLNPSEYYDKGLNLDCYALDSSGNRRRDELCLSNPKTVEIVTQEVFDLLNANLDLDELTGADKNAPLSIVSLTQADDVTACKCEECVRCAKEHGGYSAPNLLFVNQVAQAIKDAGYNNVAIDTFAYKYTRNAPKGIVPLDNVIIRLCTIECCNSHYVDDENCMTNKAFMNDLADWSKICSNIYIWDYCTDFAYFMTIFPNINVVAHNIRVFHEYNVVGIYEEGNFTLSPNGADPEFNELRSYVISKVMKDPYCDYQQAIKDFCNAYYGEAGGDMYTFITKIDTYAGRRHLNIYKDPRLILSCNDSELSELNELFEHAKTIATGYALENVKSSEISWRYYKMFNNLFEFSDSENYDELEARLYIDIGNSKAGRMHENEESYTLTSIYQTVMIDLYPLFELIVNKFVYGP